jgi:hypothetical protein
MDESGFFLHAGGLHGGPNQLVVEIQGCTHAD